MRARNSLILLMLCLSLAFWACSGGGGNGASGVFTPESNSSATNDSVYVKTAWDYLNPDIEYGEFTDARDGMVYKTIKIGEQTWMAQNLNYDYNEESARSFCYNNCVDSCAKYGRLYQWSAAMDSAAVFSEDAKGCGEGMYCNLRGIVRGVCPEGWHLTREADWDTLYATVGGANTAGMLLMSRDYGLDDPYGFSAIPAGMMVRDGSYSDIGVNAYFFTSEDSYGDGAYAIIAVLSNRYYGARSGYNTKVGALPVRCLKN